MNYQRRWFKGGIVRLFLKFVEDSYDKYWIDVFKNKYGMSFLI